MATNGMTGCLAAESGIYFRPDGQVMACCSGWHVLGAVHGPARRSLRDIWEGAEARQLRRALDAGDFSLGCFECGQLAADGRRDDSLARQFDRYSPTADGMPQMMDFAMSDRCNLQCVQCSGSYSSAIRRHREGRAALDVAYDDRFFDELDEFLPHLRRAQFKGGEPFLTTLNRRVWDALLACPSLPEVSLTTNGTVWTPLVERYTEALAAEVYISVDAGDDHELERIRVGADAARLWQNVANFRDVTARTGRRVELSFCLMSINWRQLAPLLQRADDVGVDVGVIWVGGPGSLRLLSLSGGELREVLDEMSRQSHLVEPLSPPLRDLWSATLRQIESSLDDATTSVGSPTLRREREPESGATPVRGDALTLRFRNEVMVRVEVPEWAQWLRPGAWVGIGLRDTMMAIGTSVGGPLHSDVQSVSGGDHLVTLKFDRDGASHTLVGRYSEEGDSDASVLTFRKEA